ncbi:PTS sugar transporter subunit IIA [Cytobacillus sp. Hz8]|uniref:PTS sugar transporter subunit IIA n=1 Tax=Cytobacillus sp. Hz8 TaxID=3347168 RepID=UPI0035DBD0FC
MNQFILASHSDLAHGMKKAIKMLTGIDEGIISFGLQDGENVNEILESAKEIIANASEGDVFTIVTDIPGGSVNNALMELINEENVYLLSGMNIPLMLNLVLKPEINPAEIQDCVEIAQKTITYFDKSILEEENEEEDFFD